MNNVLLVGKVDEIFEDGFKMNEGIPVYFHRQYFKNIVDIGDMVGVKGHIEIQHGEETFVFCDKLITLKRKEN